MTIEAVLFDYSGVLTTALSPPTEDVPYDTDALMVEMVELLAGVDDNPWKALERGEIALAEFIDFVEDRVAGAGVLFAVGSDLNVMANLELRPERLELAAAVAARGLRTGLVTNNVAEWEPLWRPRLPDAVFEVVIDSAQVGCRKPDAAIYELALEQLAITDPASVLFIDDFEWNVTGAEAMGMSGLHCTTDTDLAAALSSIFQTPERRGEGQGGDERQAPGEP